METKNGNYCKLEKISSRNIRRICRVFSLLFAKHLYFNFWGKGHYQGYATINCDTDVSQFISQSTDLLLITKSYSTRCHEHTEECIANPQHE